MITSHALCLMEDYHSSALAAKAGSSAGDRRLSCCSAELDGTDIQPLSYANLSEWSPTMMRDLWTRSGISIKAQFRPYAVGYQAGWHSSELIFGNNTTNCYVNAHGCLQTNLSARLSHLAALGRPNKSSTLPKASSTRSNNEYNAGCSAAI